jgi:hypothetical protein
MKKEFHHIGIPTTKKQANEIYLADCKLNITDATQHEHRIEWLRFEKGTTMPPLLQKTAHVAYAVENLDAALAGKTVIVPPFAPMAGLRVAFIDDAGAPVEFLEFAKTGH